MIACKHQIGNVARGRAPFWGKASWPAKRRPPARMASLATSANMMQNSALSARKTQAMASLNKNDRPEQGKKRAGSAKPKISPKSIKLNQIIKSDKFGDDSVKSDRFRRRDIKKLGRDNFDHESAPRPSKAKNDKPKGKNQPFRGQSLQSRERTERASVKTSSKGNGNSPRKNGSGGQKDGGKLRLKRPKNGRKAENF